MKRKKALTLFFTLTLLMVGLISTSGSSVRHVSAATNSLSLNVISARTEPRAFGGTGVIKGDTVTQFKYIINEDNTGTTEQRTPAPGSGCSPQDAGYPDSCNWPSIAAVQYPSPVYTQGDQDDFIGGGLNLPNGRYLISVLADGYKLDGIHFTVPLPDPDPITGANVTVELQPTPLPDSTIRTKVFADIAPTNGTPDVGDPGLAGFVGHINDYIGEVQTDVYGNPLCTLYEGEDPVTRIIDPTFLDADMLPVPIPGTGGNCVSDANGDLVIPHLGSNRYTLAATPPDGQTWIQTTTLEGNHDWDTWIMEGATGLDTEFVLAGEPFPQPIFGFAPPNNTPEGNQYLGTLGSGSGHITGVVVGIKSYTPPKGGAFNFWGGHVGTKVDAPIDSPWISLADLQAGDVAVWVGQGNADGSFDISGVPDGNYTLTWWDEPQNYNVNFINVTVSNGQTVDMGNLPLNGWWTKYEGYVFNDLNRNGVKDAGEPGVPNYTLTMRRRENTLMDRGQNTATTDSNGYFLFESGYPLGEWTIMEAYHDLYYTTGITYQADNQPTPTTVKGAGVDLGVLNIIGLGGRVDWGVHFYDPSGANGIDPRNGGIVGTVSYDTTRNELDPQFAATEDWQPGVAGLPVNLYTTVYCGTNPGTPCDPTENFELAPDGSYAKGQLLNNAITENWTRPTGCTARDVDGNPLVHGIDEQVLVTNQETNGECIESFIQGVQFGPYPTDQGTSDANFGAAVDGNYGFGDGCFGVGGFDVNTGACADGSDPIALPAGDYLVEVAIPTEADVFGANAVNPTRPLYAVTREEDINVANGNQVIPQVPPPACAGPLHTVDVADMGTDSYPANTTFIPGVTVPPSTPTINAPFVDMGGTFFEGQPRPLCDTKLVTLNNGKSIAPIFNIFTDVPIPSRLRGMAVDDINFSTDPRSIMFGEKTGIPFIPIGIYDFSNRLVTTLETDFNGIYEVLLPSTNHISCPTPAGVCANMYRFVANDPGIPGRLNPNWNPRYRTIATEFEAYPGMIIPTDLAPTQVGLTVEAPGTGVLNAVTCALDSATPQLLAVSQPYVNGSGSFTINGLGFGSVAGQVTLDDTIILPTSPWSDTQINVSVPAGTPTGPHQLNITAANGQSTVNGLTFHVIGGSYNPNLYEVGPGQTYAVIQDAIDAAVASNGNDLVVVYPGNPDFANPRGNPRGAYYVNLILTTPIKLQGVGPGGFQGNTFVPGSILDGGAFGGDTALATDWFTKVGSLTWDGNQNVNDGEVIYILANDGVFTSNFKATIDGFDIRGGDQQGFPGNINDLTGAPTGLPPGITTQGGAIFANAYARYLQITNNVVQNNGGGYGTVRIGTPDLPAPDTNQHNENIRIANNRIISNGGTNLAGGIGLFAGADNYEVAHNDICGNFSVEYGGGLSVYGRSPNGKIHHNRIYFNMSNDEGGGIMIAGELPTTLGALSPGSGPVDIYNNQIQANMANDDGGGIRFLMAGGNGGVDAMNVYNNMIVNNISTHEGGGISLNDAPNVRVYNNTIMKNLTTSTALTSNGQPYPAGLSTVANSSQLQATLPGGAPTFSNPLLFNNIFWDNRAGTRAGTTVTGIGLAGDANPIDYWDLGVADGTGVLAPTNSVIQQQNTVVRPYTADPSNSAADPGVVQTYDVSVSFATWRQNAGFVDATIVTLEAPPNLLGDYHLAAGSPAIDLATASKNSVNAPATDFDDQARPADAGFDSGADEFGADVPPPPPADSNLYFSTSGNTNPPGVNGSADDADIYNWDGSAFSRIMDASTIGIPSSGFFNANVDGLEWVDDTHFYVSFTSYVFITGFGWVADEDVVYYDAGTWSIFFDGSANGLNGGFFSSFDLDAISIVDNTLYFSTDNNSVPTGAGGSGDDADIYRWNGGSSYTRIVDASTIGIPSSGSGNADVDGLVWVDATHFYLSFNNTTTNVAGLGNVQDEDVVYYDGGTWSVHFDGTDPGLTSGNADLDAISFAAGTPPPPTPPTAVFTADQTNGDLPYPVQFTDQSTDNPTSWAWDFGDGGSSTSQNPSHTYTTAGIYTVSLTVSNSGGSDNETKVDYVTVTNPPPPPTAAFTADQTSGDHPYPVQFTDQSTDNPTSWAWDFGDGGSSTSQSPSHTYTTAGIYTVSLTVSNSGGSDAETKVAYVTVTNPPTGASLYFSTVGNAVIPGVAAINPPGIGYDNADIYGWDGANFSRVFDANSGGNLPLPGGANIDGLVLVDETHFFLSFAGTNTNIPGFETVQDEDVVEYNNGVWEIFFDGTANSLTTNGQDLDAINIVGSVLYFSTVGGGNSNSIPGVAGPFDDADIYSWDKNTGIFDRVFDASANGLPGNADVDGLAWGDSNNFFLSFKATNTTNIPDIGTAGDEDVVQYSNGTWSLYFDGSAHGLNASNAQDLDAFSFFGGILP